MRNRRFIFTIDKDTQDYINKVASEHSYSKSKALKYIIKEKELENPIVDGEDDSMRLQKFSIATDIYSTPNIGKIIHRPDFIDHISNDDVDFLLFVIDDLLLTQPDNLNLKIVYARLLRHRGLLIEAKKLLLNIDDFDLERNLLLLSIAIQTGDIRLANSLLIRSKEIINLSPHVSQSMVNDFNVLSAEFYWINNGVTTADKFVTNLIPKYLIINEELTLGKLYCLRGEFLRDKGSYQEAEINYKKALKFFEKYPFEGNYLARIFKGLGSVYKNNGENRLAYDHLLIALNIAKKFGDKITEAGVLASIAGFYFTQDKTLQGEKALTEKRNIGEETGSIREKFYASYDLSLVTIEKGDFNKAMKLIDENFEGAIKFKRSYYLKMWKGYIESKTNLEKGLEVIKQCKQDAIEANEDKRIHLADYLFAASIIKYPNRKQEAVKIMNSLVNDPMVSKQLKKNINYLAKNPKLIKAI